jgi:type II secretory pathway pseudopilin PulG
VVVIVVIGILASISVVAYRGVQERARTVAINTAVAQWDRILQMYMIQGGDMSVPSDAPSAAFTLGRTSDFAGHDSCKPTLSIGGYDSMLFSTTFMNKLTDSVGEIPNGFSYKTRVEGVDYCGIQLWLRNDSFGKYSLYWMAQKRGDCGPGEGMTASMPEESIPPGMTEFMELCYLHR